MSQPAFIVLAAGKGKRMKSDLPKVLSQICGQALIVHILRTIFEHDAKADVAVVVGVGKDAVINAVKTDASIPFSQVEWVAQSEQRGTGDAVRCAIETEWGRSRVARKCPFVVLPGDQPCLSGDLLKAVSQPLKRSVLRLITVIAPDPTGYGRVIRKGAKVSAIIEEKDANEKQKQIQEIGTSVYFFEPQFLAKEIGKLGNKNAQKEYYLTDLVARAKGGVEALQWNRPEELQGINTPWELSRAEKTLNQILLKSFALEGVKFQDPDSVWIDRGVQVDGSVEIASGVQLKGRTRIDAGVKIGPDVYLQDVVVFENAEIRKGTVAEKSKIGRGATVGPYAHLRPETEIGPECRVGNFVELKKTRIGAKSSVAHLSYLGDAEVGSGVNIGCGFVTCNYDGRVIDGERKHRSIIGNDAFVGSDCQVVAPVKIGEGAYIASGSTITEDVPAHDLAIARSRQVNKPGYAKKLKQMSGNGFVREKKV